MSSGPKPPRSNKEELEEGCLGVLLVRTNGPGPRLENVLDFSRPPRAHVLSALSGVLHPRCSSNRSLCGVDSCVSVWAQSSPGSSKQGFAGASQEAPLGHQPSSSFDSVKDVSQEPPFPPCALLPGEMNPRYAVAYAGNPRVFSSANFPQIPESVTPASSSSLSPS